MSAVIQRAPVYWQPSSRTSASYSAFQAVLHHFELQLADGAQQHRAADLGAEHLDRAFFAELGQALLQLLGAQRVLQHHGHEEFGREEGQAGELQVARRR